MKKRRLSKKQKFVKQTVLSFAPPIRISNQRNPVGLRGALCQSSGSARSCVCFAAALGKSMFAASEEVSYFHHSVSPLFCNLHIAYRFRDEAEDDQIGEIKSPFGNTRRRQDKTRATKTRAQMPHFFTSHCLHFLS